MHTGKLLMLYLPCCTGKWYILDTKASKHWVAPSNSFTSSAHLGSGKLVYITDSLFTSLCNIAIKLPATVDRLSLNHLQQLANKNEYNWPANTFSKKIKVYRFHYESIFITG